MSARARRIVPAGWNLIRTMGCNLIRKTSCCRSSKKSSRTSSRKANWSLTTTNRMTTNQTNQNSKTSMSLIRCRSWMKTIRNYGQSCGDVTSRNCPRCGYRRHRNLPGARRFRRHHALAEYVRPVAAFVVEEFLAALCTAAYLDIFRPDSNRCGDNSGCRMSCFDAVQP